MDSSYSYNQLPVAHELAGSLGKGCSRKPTSEQVKMPVSRNSSGLCRIANALNNYQLTGEEKQMIVDLAAALMGGDLNAARKVIDGMAGGDVRRLAKLRDTLSLVLPVAGQIAVQIMPGDIFTAQLGPGKPIEAIYITLKCTRSNEAVGIPSNKGLPVQVFKTMFMGSQNKVLQTDERADPSMVFRRISGLLAHSDVTAPPPPWHPGVQ